MIFFGALLIIGLFILFTHYTQEVNEFSEKELEEISTSFEPELLRSILGGILGGLNGLCIVIFEEIYKQICLFVTNWENHQF